MSREPADQVEGRIPLAPFAIDPKTDLGGIVGRTQPELAALLLQERAGERVKVEPRLAFDQEADVKSGGGTPSLRHVFAEERRRDLVRR